MTTQKSDRKIYEDELTGQKEFFETYLPRVDKDLDIQDVQHDYSDGIVNGNIIEFKLYITDLNQVLYQTIKYLSKLRLKGHSIPANIILISLNQQHAYVFQSGEYLNDIEKIYYGAASKGNEGFQCKTGWIELDYNNALDEEKLIKLLREKSYTKIHIDEDCIVGWAKRYYKENPHATKADFIGDKTGKINIIGEIRKPTKFKDYIYPYVGDSNEKFRYLMDRLNDELSKKDLGAFYTHPLYAKKSLDLVRQAIRRVPKGNDYIILDRCAGTGNLELGLSDEELSHTIVSTIEYYEYKILIETIGDKVRHIIPPTEHEDTFVSGQVRGADALSKEYIHNEIIRQYIEDEKCTIILFENTPFSDSTSIEHQKGGNSKQSGNKWKTSYVATEMKRDLKARKISGQACGDIGNLFIWSAFAYYLRQPTDSYIVYSPAKYWKAQHLISKKMLGGFAFNRKHFHRETPATIMVVYWSNEDDQNLSDFALKGYDIVENQLVEHQELLPIKKIHYQYSEKYFDKRPQPEDKDGGILCSKDGTERFNSKTVRVHPKTNPNIIGYMAVYSSGFDNPDNMSSLLVAARYDGNGFYLRKDNYLEKLPLFAASRYVTYNRAWTERGRIMKSADGAQLYYANIKTPKAQQQLLKCLLFTILEPQNHMLEFIGSNNIWYKNQLCLDTTNGNTIASEDIKKLKKNNAEEQLLKQWEFVLSEAKKTHNYNKEINYGLYQIKKELNTSHKDKTARQTVYDYPSLNGSIRTLAEMVKKYYFEEIVPFLFEYEFLK